MPLTSIPDMRFEQSFLASVRGFIHEVKSNEAALAIKREHVEGEEEEAEAEAEGEKGARTKKQAPAEDPLVDDTLGAGLHPIHGREPREDEAAHTVVASHAPTGEPELWIGRLRIEWCVRSIAGLWRPGETRRAREARGRHTDKPLSFSLLAQVVHRLSHAARPALVSHHPGRRLWYGRPCTRTRSHLFGRSTTASARSCSRSRSPDDAAPLPEECTVAAK